MEDDKLRPCEVLVLQRLSSSGATLLMRCGQPAVYFLVGTVGWPGGKIFVCEQHQGRFQYRLRLSVEEYFIREAERLLGG